MTGVLPSRELGAHASSAHGAVTSAEERSQEQAPAPGDIHGRPGQMIEHNVYPIRKPWITRLPSPLPPYALPIPDVNHVRISGDDRYWCCFERLARWQRTAPAVPARAGWIAVPARYARVVRCGVRQPCCRASRACDHVEVAAVTPQLCAQWDHVSGSIPLPTTITRGATFGVQQPCCRASCTHDPARGIPLPILVTGVLECTRFDH